MYIYIYIYISLVVTISEFSPPNYPPPGQYCGASLIRNQWVGIYLLYTSLHIIYTLPN
jgi:hypothetical protein